MRIIHTLQELAQLERPIHLALGVFDGIHVGHQAVFRGAMAVANHEGGLAGVLTFDPHPIGVIAPHKAPTALLATLKHKAEVIEKLGLDLFILLHFDAEFAKIEAATFLSNLLNAGVKTIAVGEDWRFGHGRSGDVHFLRRESIHRFFNLEAVSPVMRDGDRISSTRIRQAIRDGNLNDADAMLGRPYTLVGKVVEGQKIGRTLGFPTANLATDNAQLPPNGVWAVTAQLEDFTFRKGVANLGWRPTINGMNQVLEVHLFEHQSDLYGQELKLHFDKFIRPEVKFPSLNALRAQITSDVSTTKDYFQNKSL